jgi:peptide/nickel transport system substrate-binding protein
MDFWTNGLQFNCAKPPFDDPEIRWALNYAMSRQQIVDIGFKGNTTSTVLPFAAFPAMQPYVDEVKNLLVENPIDTYDIDKTAQIMQKKGYAKDSGGFWATGGNRFSFVILTSPGFFENFATVMVAGFRKAGFDASYKAPTNAGTLEVSGEADVWIDGYQGTYNDPYYGLEEFHSRHSAPIGQPADFGHRWKNDQFDKIVDDMAKLPSSDPKFHDLYRQGMAIWIKELPSAPTVQWNLICPVDSTYWKTWPDANYPYAGPHLWHRGDAALVINTLDPV